MSPTVSSSSHQILVRLGRIAKPVHPVVFSPGQIELVTHTVLRAKTRGTAHIPHRVPAPPKRTRICVAAVHEPSVVETRLVGLQHTVDRP